MKDSNKVPKSRNRPEPPSQQPLALDASSGKEELLKEYPIAIISGGSYQQFKTQLLGSLPIPDELLEKLYLLPTSGTSLYKYFNKEWVQIYSEELTFDEKKKIFNALDMCFKNVGFVIPEKPLYGDIVEDRGTQITFSALGQRAPLNLKSKWDPNHLKRLEMIGILQQNLKDFSIKSGGTTSLDITIAGRDKSYGIAQIEKYLGFKKENMVYLGDGLHPGGNDLAVKQAGVYCIETTGPTQTMEIIKNILNGII